MWRKALIVAAAMGVVIYGATEFAFLAQEWIQPEGRELASKGKQSCTEPTLREVYRILRTRNRLASGYLKNQKQYLSEINELLRGAQKTRKVSEGLFYVGSGLLAVPSALAGGAAYASKIGLGLVLVNLGKVGNERLLIGDYPKLDFVAADDTIDSEMVLGVADVKTRVESRLEFFAQQHRELSENYGKVLRKFPSGIWGRIRNSLTFGADDAQYMGVVLAEATYREDLYSIEVHYTDRAMTGILEICAISDGGNRLDSRDLLHLVPLL